MEHQVLTTEEIEKLVSYVVAKMQALGAKDMTKPKVMAILYLIDVECYREKGRTLSGLSWRSW